MDLLDNLFSPLLVLLTIGLFLLYKWITRNRYYFADRGIAYKKPDFLFGNMRKIALSQQSLNDNVLELYNYFPDEKITGIFELMNAITQIRDPELIKQIGVKDCDYFLNHRTPIDIEADPLFGRSLFSMKDDKWRDMRSTLSPAFTGSKMRSMFELVMNCSEEMKDFLLEESNQKQVVVEMKDLFTRFANDVIATCAFGIQTNSLKDRKNEFFEMGSQVTNFNKLQSLKFFGFTNAPKLMKALRISLFSDKIRNFFRRVVMGNIRYREENNVHRPDMIQLLMQAKKGHLSHETEKGESADAFAVVEEAAENVREPTKKQRVWEDDDLTGQCLLFFFAGFDTASTLLCFIGHELAVNPDVQEKLIEEVDIFREQLDGKPMTYETINKMTYLDMVVSETLRKWPPAVATDRVCTMPYKLNVDGRSYDFKVGDMLWIPIFAVQRDPKYYPEPEKFDPERFSVENRKSINPNAYLPFGVGQRACIGSRFALMETKAILYSLLSAFTFEVSEKTQVPLRLQKGGFAIRGEKGFWIHLKRRETSSN